MTITAFKMNPVYLEAKRAEYAAQVAPDKPLLPLFVNQTVKVLLGDKKAYLRYGPYWWAVKRILVANDAGVGTYMEPHWADEYAAADDELTLIAAWEFADDAMGRFGVQTREYDLDDVAFLLYDPDQEEVK
ncbi:hypothetical protein PQR05_29425 [Paraburkholderia sediminicola]|uniref:hypothetical protein n=1 Tax=Paraburkholderia sediminicola TaxID=458836 RepID=UPI0038BBD590